MKTWSIVILPYMVSEMKLSGNDLIIYAFINGFCNAKGHGWHGNLATMSEHTGMSVKTCQRCLLNLEQKGFINKLKSKTIVETDTGKIVNSLPLYIAAYSEAMDQIVDQNIEQKTDSEIDTKVDVADIEAKETIISGKVKAKKSNKDTRFSEAKQYFLETYKKLHSEGKLPSELTSVNSGLINKRLKDLFEKNVTPAQMKLTFEEMGHDSFCVNQLRFELAPLLSETVFFKWYNVAASKYQNKKSSSTLVKKTVVKHTCYCNKCGRELYNGICGNCDIDKLF